jgi:integrase
VALIKADYVQKGNRTWWRVEHALLHLRPAFEHLPAARIDYDRVSRYTSARLEGGAAPGTVHHEIAALGRMLKLGVPAGRLQVRPPLPVLKLDNIRKGFFTDDEVRRVLTHLPDWYAPAIEFCWRTRWRSGEVRGLSWAQVDFRASILRLEPGTTKNRKGRVFPFVAFPALAALLHRQWESTQEWQRMHGQIVPWVFWRNGRQLGDHRDKWTRACRLAGLPGRLVHDLRRSAMRNLERAAVPRSSAMKLTGHLAESVYRRYAIVSEADLAEDVARLAAFQQRDGGMTSVPNRPAAGTSTVPAQFASAAIVPESTYASGAVNAATGTHDTSGTSASALSPAALPATVPLDHAHWKLNPPSLPSTSSTSPQR